MRMRAAVLERFGEALVVQEVSLDDPGPGEALVRLVACGVCHTDLYTASGVDPSGYAPTVLGQEGAGVVEAVGDGVGDVSVGDHMVTLFSPPMPPVPPLPGPAHEPVPGDPRAAEPRLSPGWHGALVCSPAACPPASVRR
jgi:NADPH:quinone reductase-like Zn-dependent oxidoreductase